MFLMQVLEIDPLAQRISSMSVWQEQTAVRLNNIEEKLNMFPKEIAAVIVRVTELENQFTIIDGVRKEMTQTNDNFSQLKKAFDHLRVEARDALLLSQEVKHFKTELQELQEDVTTVLNQAPQTERLMAQVQQNLEANAEQLMGMSSKTAFMESSISKILTSTEEFKYMKEDLNRRMIVLENPKIDRLGILENQSRAMSKQVGVLQHNWMTNWGAHEASLQTLKEELMLHIDQIRMQGVGVGGQGDNSTSGNLTFVRMDEEEKQALRKQIDQLHRDINRMDNKKADSAMIHKLLEDKADNALLDKKMDVSDFDQRLAHVQKLIDNWNDRQSEGQQPTLLARSLTPFSSSSGRPGTAGTVASRQMSETMTRQMSEMSDPADEFVQQLPDDVVQSMHMMAIIDQSRSHQQPPRPASTPPVVSGSHRSLSVGVNGGNVKGSKTVVRYTSGGQQIVYDDQGQPLVNRALSAQSKAKGSSPSFNTRQSRPAPGKIRPSTAGGGMGPAVYILGVNDKTNKRQVTQVDATLSLTAQSIRPGTSHGKEAGEDNNDHWDNASPMGQLGNWDNTSQKFSPVGGTAFESYRSHRSQQPGSSRPSTSGGPNGLIEEDHAGQDGDNGGSGDGMNAADGGAN